MGSPTFPQFSSLPSELRLKIWHASFLPRVVELHPTRPFYSDDHDAYQHSQPPKWQSGCANPAALSACAESRAAALEHYTVAFPLASVGRHEPGSESGSGSMSGPGPAGGTGAPRAAYGYAGYYFDDACWACSLAQGGDLRRILYVAPRCDTVAVLGDLDFRRLSALLMLFAEADPDRVGLRRLALSVTGWSSVGSVSMMHVFKRTLFRNLEQLVLFMYGGRFPPQGWSKEMGGGTSPGWTRRSGGKCELVDCEGSSAWQAYKVWSSGRGRQFWDDDGRIMHVGTRELRIMDLLFKEGW